jgi:hypothetical protein
LRSFTLAARQRGWRQNGTCRDSVRGVMQPLAAAAWVCLFQINDIST